METILSAFLSWQFLFLCLAIGAVVFVIRQAVEFAMENVPPFDKWGKFSRKAKLWRELILPTFPIVMGAVITWIAKEYPFPEEFISQSGRLTFGIVAGFSSGFVVKLYKSFFASKVSELSETVSKTIKTTKDGKIKIEEVEHLEDEDKK